MTTVSEHADARANTCSIVPAGGRLPDLARLERGVRDMRLGATLRGVEAVVTGALVEEGGRLILVSAGTGERVRLDAASRGVRWDTGRDREAPLTEPERRALGRLERARRERGPESLVRVTGRLQPAEGGASCALEVREFRWVEKQ